MLAHVFTPDSKEYWYSCKIDESSTSSIQDQAIFSMFKDADDSAYESWFDEEMIRKKEDDDEDEDEVVAEYKIDEDGDFVVKDAYGEWICGEYFGYEVFTSKEVLDMAVQGEVIYLRGIFDGSPSFIEELIEDLISEQNTSEGDYEVYCLTTGDECGLLDHQLMRKVDGELVEFYADEILSFAVNGKVGYLKNFIEKQKEGFPITFDDFLCDLEQ